MVFNKFLNKNKNKNENNDNIKFDIIPKHVAIIMDGNGRWAKKRGMPRLYGHKEGADNLKKVVREFKNFGVKYVTVYAFSTENWRRPETEVKGLMKLLLKYLKNAEKELGGDNVRISVIGNRSGLPDEIQEEIKRVELITDKNNGINLIIALNYGSRDEIVKSFNDLLGDIRNKKIQIDNITEEDISNYLYTKNIPDPDLLIRTSGELRISNYLLWQIAYAELWFTDVYWPEFGKSEIIEALSDFNNRKRRFGGI